MNRAYLCFSLLLFALFSSRISQAQCSALPSTTTAVRFDLPYGLTPGIYFIKVTGPGEMPLIARVLKN